jgi:UTP--glucose-1-phosphate uridylyltransferase
VTARGKGALEDYFDIAGELVATLKERGKAAELAVLDETQLAPGQIAYVRQQEPAGLGHAVWCARHITGDEPFAVLLPDELLWNPGDPCLAQMVRARNEVGGTVIAVMEVPEEETHRYGIVDPGATKGALTQVKGFVEKPKAGTAPSRLAAVGRYLIEPECMTILGEGKRGAGGEIQLTDALAQLIGKQPFHAYTYSGARFDCGDKAGHVTANIALALERADIGPAVGAWLKANVK